MNRCYYIRVDNICIKWNNTQLKTDDDVIMGTIASQITSLPIVYWTVYWDAENIKAPRHWPLCGEFTGDRWVLALKRMIGSLPSTFFADWLRYDERYKSYHKSKYKLSLAVIECVCIAPINGAGNKMNIAGGDLDNTRIVKCRSHKFDLNHRIDSKVVTRHGRCAACKFHSNRKVLNTNLTALRLCKLLR